MDLRQWKNITLSKFASMVGFGGIKKTFTEHAWSTVSELIDYTQALFAMR